MAFETKSSDRKSEGVQETQNKDLDAKVEYALEYMLAKPPNMSSPLMKRLVEYLKKCTLNKDRLVYDCNYASSMCLEGASKLEEFENAHTLLRLLSKSKSKSESESESD